MVFRATWTDLLFLPWLYVMGWRGVLRYLSSNRRCMRMLRVFWMRRIWPKPIRLYKKTVEVELCNLILKQARRCARKLRVLWTRRIWSKLKRLCEQKAEVGHQEKQATSSNISDPIEHAEDDELGFNAKVCELAKELRGLDLKERSTCYGIIAPWGYGKTSFLNLLSNELSADGIVVTFNPRSAKSVDHIQEDFFAKLAQELSQHYWGAGLIVSRYAEQIGILNHYSKVRLIADALRLLRFKGSKATVSNAIEKIGKRLYIVLDDLDRLEGEELLETIKLIDVNADFKNTVFLVACDKKYANDVLQEYLGGNPGQGYLDKYIVREIQLSGYINDKLAKIMAGYLHCEIEDGDIVIQKAVLDAWNRIAPYIVPHLGSLRHLKRYYGFFIDDFKRVQDYVDPVDFFLLILLKYKDPGVYEAVKHRIRFQSGSPSFSLYSTDRWNGVSPLSSVDELDLRYYATMEEEYSRDLNNQLDSVIQTAQWNGVVTFLWMLFPNSRMFSDGQLPSDFKDNYWRKSDAPYSSIRYRRGFSSYFPDLSDDERELWHQDVFSIVKSNDRTSVYGILDRRCKEKDEADVARLLLNLIDSPYQSEEERITTLQLILYIVDQYDTYPLRSRIEGSLKRKRNFSIGEKGIWGSKKIMDKVFAGALQDHPLLVCELLGSIENPMHDVGWEYIYTEEEASELVLKALKRYFDKYAGSWISRCQDILNKLLQDGARFKFKHEVALLVITWVQIHPEESINLLLHIERETPRRLYVRLQRYVKELKANGFSTNKYLHMLNASEAKEVFDVVMRDNMVECLDFAPSRRLDDISYIYEAFVGSGLIHPGSED